MSPSSLLPESPSSLLPKSPSRLLPEAKNSASTLLLVSPSSLLPEPPSGLPPSPKNCQIKCLIAGHLQVYPLLQLSRDLLKITTPKKLNIYQNAHIPGADIPPSSLLPSGGQEQYYIMSSWHWVILWVTLTFTHSWTPPDKKWKKMSIWTGKKCLKRLANWHI